MKQSRLTNFITVQGKNGTGRVDVVVTMNFTTTENSGTHGVTHDDYSKTVPVHKVEAIYGDKVIETEKVQTEEQVLTAVKTMIEKAKTFLFHEMNKEKSPSLQDKFDALFTK